MKRRRKGLEREMLLRAWLQTALSRFRLPFPSMTGGYPTYYRFIVFEAKDGLQIYFSGRKKEGEAETLHS